MNGIVIVAIATVAMDPSGDSLSMMAIHCRQR